jgi:hypothetical protein
MLGWIGTQLTGECDSYIPNCSLSSVRKTPTINIHSRGKNEFQDLICCLNTKDQRVMYGYAVAKFGESMQTSGLYSRRKPDGFLYSIFKT